MKIQPVSKHGGCHGLIGDLQHTRQFGSHTVYTNLFKVSGEDFYSVSASAQDPEGKWTRLFDRCDACCAAGLTRTIADLVKTL